MRKRCEKHGMQLDERACSCGTISADCLKEKSMKLSRRRNKRFLFKMERPSENNHLDGSRAFLIWSVWFIIFVRSRSVGIALFRRLDRLNGACSRLRDNLIESAVSFSLVSYQDCRCECWSCLFFQRNICNGNMFAVLFGSFEFGLRFRKRKRRWEAETAAKQYNCTQT